jgi:hypothetical protein
MNSQVKAPIAVGLGAIASLGALFCVNPAAAGVFPDCPSRMLFGVDCPACGGMRATFALLRGDIASAAEHNALLLGFYPMVVTLWLSWIVRSLGQRDFLEVLRPYSRSITITAFSIVVGFTILRNLTPYLGSGLGS